MTITAIQILEKLRAPAGARAALYMGRIEQHLPTLAADKRLPFLKSELEKWMNRYSAWALRIDTGTADEADLSQTAWDYTETIGAIQRRINDLSKSVPAFQPHVPA